MTDHQYRNTSIYVRDPSPTIWDTAALDPDPQIVGVAPAVGEYRDLVFQQLDQIRAFGPMTNFFTLITACGKRQVICFVGTGVPNDNSCSGSGAGKKKIITNLGTGGWSAARCDLNTAIAAWCLANIGVNADEWLAEQVLTSQLHRWNPADTSANSPYNPRGIGLGLGEWDQMVQMLARRINDYRAGRMSIRNAACDERELLDLLIIILRDHLQDGNKSSAMVRYTPMKVATGSGPRPAQVALFHELVHAYYEAQGKNLSNEDSVHEWNGRYFELAAVGLPPFDNEPYSENKLRDELVVARRIRY